jgi:hypothetical protein
MSGSPKYAAARLRAVQDRALRYARAAAAASEKGWRCAEEQRQRAERIEFARAEVARELDALRQRGVVHAATEAGRHAADELRTVDDQLARIQSALDFALDLADIQHMTKLARKARDEMEEAIARGQASAFAAGKADARSTVEELRGRIATLGRSAAERLDPQVMAQLEQLLNDALLALRQQAPARVRHCLDEARGRLERHENDAKSHCERYAEARDHSVAALADVSDRVAGLYADPVVIRWAAEPARALAQRVEEARSLIDAGEFAATQHMLAELTAQIEPLVETAQATQLNEDRRNYIVAEIVQVMGQMGFVVQAGSPSL